MRHRKVIVGAILLLLFGGLATFGLWLGNRPILAWKVRRVRAGGPYWIRDGMEAHCWFADIEVTNLTSGDVIVDWNRDKLAFQIDGHWEDLSLAAFMPHLFPHENATIQLVVPQRAQACRLLMHYENDPLWKRADEFLRDHGIYVSDKFLIPAMRFNKKLPGHFRLLDIEVKLPVATSKVNGTEGSGEQWDLLRLERIAKNYASQHNVDFDFTNAKLFRGFLSSNIAVINFLHDADQPYFEAQIDSNGNVIQTRIRKLEPVAGGGQPTPTDMQARIRRFLSE